MQNGPLRNRIQQPRHSKENEEGHHHRARGAYHCVYEEGRDADPGILHVRVSRGNEGDHGGNDQVRTQTAAGLCANDRDGALP